ncbi:MAG: alpha/beta hydrolase [Parachlamydiaceae bacterium]|nr:alpha/beta hydrolase [Parachlamydiaceae bacterium]
MFCFLIERRRIFFANVLATFLIEPQNALRAAYLMKKGLDRKKLVNLNPTRLSPDQLKCAPVLFIHGDSSNSGLFAPMINQVVRDNPYKPIFTIDLASADGVVSAKNHLHLIVAKVKEIIALYPSSKTPKISFVGHSSGGDVLGPLVRVMEEEKWPYLGTIIKIGSIFKKIEAEEFWRYPYGKIIEIMGTKDVFEGCESHLSNKLVVASGHLGLLFNKVVLKRISTEIGAL